VLGAGLRIHALAVAISQDARAAASARIALATLAGLATPAGGVAAAAVLRVRLHIHAPLAALRRAALAFLFLLFLLAERIGSRSHPSAEADQAEHGAKMAATEHIADPKGQSIETSWIHRCSLRVRRRPAIGRTLASLCREGADGIGKTTHFSLKTRHT